jgi:hypothetical protein
MKNTFLKLFLLILSLFSFSAADSQKGEMLLSRWHKSDKIEESDYQYIRKPGMYFLISNDKDNIYIDIRIDDDFTQKRILKEGLTVWIDMDGKQSRKLGVRFPMGSEDNPAVSMANTIELIGFVSEQERHIPAANADNFNGMVKFDDSGKLFYRLVMPIAKLPVRNSKKGNSAMPLFLGFEYGYSAQVRKPREITRQPKSSKVRSVNPSVKGSGLFWIRNIKLATSK